MPKFASNPEEYEGAVFWPIWPCDFQAADGTFIPGEAFYVDTDTGVVIMRKLDANGQPVIWDRGSIGGMVEIVAVYPPPLKIMPYSPDNHIDKPIIVGGS